MPPTQKVIEHFGLDEKDIEQLDPIVDWEALAKSIGVRTAVCNILDAKGNIVMSCGKPVRVLGDVTVSNVEEELKKRSLKFIEWW